jgi:membrane-associated phospholipid phosphatase
VRRERFFAKPQRAAWVGVALLGVVALLGALVPAGPLGIDRSWSEAMKDVQARMLEHIALVFNAVGHGIARALTLAAVALVLLLARRWLALLAFALAESAAPLLSSLLKALVDRPRPPGGLVSPAGSSFPSGHAVYVGTTAVALVLLFSAAGPARAWWWAAAVVATAAMAWSRTYLQVHWLSDVVAGSLLGAGVSVVVFACAQQWQPGRLRA